MKGVPYNFTPKRRWRGLVIGVLGLVFLSMLVPLIFLLGLYNGFNSTGYTSEQKSGDQSRQAYEIMKRLRPIVSKEDIIRNMIKEPENDTSKLSAIKVTQNKGFPIPPVLESPPLPELPPSIKGTTVTGVREVSGDKKTVDSESRTHCELRYGSYCIWREEHREEMKDSMVKKLKDQLFVARAYYPSIAKLPKQDNLSREMKQNIQDLERILGDATADPDLPAEIEKKSQEIEDVIARAKSFHLECNNIDKKFRQLADLTEDEANFHMKQSAFLFQLAVQTMPKSFHCLSMRLTVEYFTSPSINTELLLTEKYLNPALHHYVIFSTNVLASAVVINSTVTHTKDSSNQVFHVLTDGRNFFAMRLWFLKSTYKEATVQVLNIEDLNLNPLDNQTFMQLSLPEEFRVSFHGGVNDSSDFRTRTEYISVFSHSHYLLPEIFQNLNKIVVLDDDVVVRRDLSALWDLNISRKVNGAVQCCAVKFDQLKNFLGHTGFNGNSCAWMSGLNVIDLVSWREQDLTNTYQRLVQEVGSRDGFLGAASLRATLLTFENQVYPLDETWALSGLGHDYSFDLQILNSHAILHYNGKMKPWLDLGIPRYKSYWKKFLNRDDSFLSRCNVNS